MPLMTTGPTELQCLVFSFLDPHDASLATLVCVGWNAVLKDRRPALAARIEANMPSKHDADPVNWAARRNYLAILKWARVGHTSLSQRKREWRTACGKRENAIRDARFQEQADGRMRQLVTEMRRKRVQHDLDRAALEERFDAKDARRIEMWQRYGGRTQVVGRGVSHGAPFEVRANLGQATECPNLVSRTSLEKYKVNPWDKPVSGRMIPSWAKQNGVATEGKTIGEVVEECTVILDQHEREGPPPIPKAIPSPTNVGRLHWGDAPRLAAARGHLELLRWLHEVGVKVGVFSFGEAAGRGDYPMLEWLRSVEAPWDTSTCAAAASLGNLDALKWLRERGCPWDSQTCTAAAWRGHTETLEWAANNGCTLKIGRAAERAKDPAVIEWLREAEELVKTRNRMQEQKLARRLSAAEHRIDFLRTPEFPPK